MENSVRNTERTNFSQSRCSHCGGSHPTEKLFRKQRKDTGNDKSPFNSYNYNNNLTKLKIWKTNKCFRYGSENHFIANFPKPETSKKKVHWNMKNTKTCAYRSEKIDKTLDNSIDKSEWKKIYASVSNIYSNAESTRIDLGDSLKLNNWILDSGATCHMTP